jgi:uncharacterized protein (DUF2236 family)
MMTSAAPTAAIPGPGSLTWRYLGDWRLPLISRRVLLLQVAHPVVGAGVADHSDFLQDRWGRLRRTSRSLFAVLGHNGTEAGLAEAMRLRELHKSIKGVDSSGRRYHALNPEAYLWVHATLFEGAVEVQRQLGRPLTDARLQGLYEEWRGLAGVLGITDRHIPASVGDFESYFADMVDNHLECNDTVRLLLRLDRRPFPPPPSWPLPAAIWTGLATPPTDLIRMITAGTLPPVLRERFGLPWTSADERRLRRLAAVIRTIDRTLPDRFRTFPTHNLAAPRQARS